jgi:hypothetical protein
MITGGQVWPFMSTLASELPDRDNFVEMYQVWYRVANIDKVCQTWPNMAYYGLLWHAMLMDGQLWLGTWRITNSIIVSFAPKCSSKLRCMHCRRVYHSLLRLVVSEIADGRFVLVVTAWVNIHTAEGRCVKVRALLDQGSTLRFISKSLCRTWQTTRQCADL